MKFLPVLIADPIDATHVDRFERPRQPDEEQRQRQAEPTIGAGEHLLDCECGRRFRSDSKWAALCPICDGESAADVHEPEGTWRTYARYHYRRVGRGRHQD